MTSAYIKKVKPQVEDYLLNALVQVELIHEHLNVIFEEFEEDSLDEVRAPCDDERDTLDGTCYHIPPTTAWHE